MSDKNELTSRPAYIDSPTDRPPGESPSGSSGRPGATDDEQFQELLGAEDTGPDDEEGVEHESKEKQMENWLLQKTREIYTTATDYLEANVTQKWETNLAHFNNQHAPTSRFRKNNFKRSNIFRPKTRSNIKNQEANLAAAAFSTQELVDIQPKVKDDEVQIVSARITRSLLQNRLESHMPWFLTVMGAYQDTKNYGVCITHQYWSYREDTDVVPALNEDGELIIDVDEEGNMIPMGEVVTTVRDDSLHCDNVAPENFLFDPMADWRDPVTSSPYIVYKIPMYANEVLEMMETIDPKTKRPQWKEYSLSQILATREKVDDRTRQAREGNSRTDPADQNAGNGYTTVWVHMNIVKINGDDMIWWSLGTQLLLTDAAKLRDLYPHLLPGQRPFTVGFSNIEAHKNYPAGDNELSAGIQAEINEVANMRVDNVKLALNKRYFVRRGSQMDLDALIRNVPGGGVMMNDPEKDIKVVETRDVTASSYQEQDRLSQEMDELVGGFNVAGQAVQQRSVAGGEREAASAGAVQDYTIRIFMQTWMEPTLNQLVQLIQMYETDETLMVIAAKDAGLWQRFGIDKPTDAMLQQQLTTKVNIGIGNTDPVKRVEKLVFAVTKSAELPGMIERIKGINIANEIFGSAGYKDSSRFFMSDEELAREQEANPPGPPPEIAVTMRELDIREADNQARHQREMAELELKREVEFSRLALQRDLKLNDLYTKLGIEKMKDQTDRDAAALRERVKQQEINMSRMEGTPQ